MINYNSLPSINNLLNIIFFYIGHTAKRDPIEGSWFVQKLCEVIRKNAYDTELNAMMLKVNNNF